MKTLLLALILATTAAAHPAVDAAQRAATGLRPGDCEQVTLAALEHGAVGYVDLEGDPRIYSGRWEAHGVGHLAPIIIDGRGRYQVLVQTTRIIPGSYPGMDTEVVTFHRFTIPDDVDAWDTWALQFFNGRHARDHYTAAEVHIGSELQPATPGPRWECRVRTMKDLGYRATMSKRARDQREQQAIEDCEAQRERDGGWRSE